MDVLKKVLSATPQIRAAAVRTEAEGRIDDGVVTLLRDAGLFRIALPRAIGGLELHPWENVEIIEAIGAADASTGWVAMIATGTSLYVSAYLDDATLAEMLGDDRVVVGFVGPRGVAVAEGEQYRVSGQWSFGSGCRHATWLASGCCVIQPDGSMKVREDGSPEWRCAVLPASECPVQETWDTTGLRGTGSHDYSASAIAVPAARTFSWQDLPTRETPLYRHRSMFLVNMAGVPLGVAAGALADYRREVGAGAEHALVSSEVAKLTALLGSARSYLRDVVSDCHEVLGRAGELPTERAATLRLSISHAFAASAEVVGRLHVLVGAAGVRRGHWLERRVRDMQTMSQHAHVGTKTYEPAGRMLLGLPPRVPLFT